MSLAAEQPGTGPHRDDTTTRDVALAPRIRELLSGLRWRIRAYTFIYGLCLIACWLVGMFWFVLLCDYGPVWMGASEMPRGARAVLLVIAGLGSAWILYRWIVRRTFAHLADHSMAVLLERKHDQFHDSLLTSVEMHEHPDHAADFNQEMLQHASADALALADSVRLRRVLRWLPLLRVMLAALVMVGSVIAFAAIPASQPTFNTAAQRIVLLDNQPWKRLALLEVQGITRATYEYDESANGGSALTSDRPRLVTVDVPFDEERRLKVASGSKVSLTINADIRDHARPNDVTLFWKTSKGNTKVPMVEGDARDGWLSFTYSEAPLAGLTESVEFTALGYDFRTPRHTIEVVQQPAVLDVQLIYERPEYLIDNARSVFKTVQTPLIAGTLAPRGSRVTFRATTNKPLEKVYIYNLETKQTEVIDLEGSKTITYTIENFERPISMEWMLVDSDGLVNESPHNVALGVREDEPPKVNVAVRGIGSAITPDAMFHAAGRITDDYWLDRAWLDVEIGDTKRQLPVEFDRGGFSEEEVAGWDIQPDDNVYQRIDFRDERTRDEDPLALKPGDKLTIGVKAADLFNLDGFNTASNPHAGVGDRYQLEVVTPDQLLSLLERRELELRRRLEQIVEELTQMRDSLVRVKNELSAESSDEGGELSPEDRAISDASEPGDKPLTAQEKAARVTALRRLRVQRAVNQSEKSRGETEGVGRALLDVVAQLENNRVDTEDRKERLRDQVAAPLLALVKEDFTELDSRLAGLNGQVNQTGELDRGQAALASEHAIAQTDDVLLKLDGVLTKMVDMETFNELLDLVRSIIEDQDEVTDATRTQRKKQLFGLE